MERLQTRSQVSDNVPACMPGRIYHPGSPGICDRIYIDNGHTKSDP